MNEQQKSLQSKEVEINRLKSQVITVFYILLQNKIFLSSFCGNRLVYIVRLFVKKSWGKVTINLYAASLCIFHKYKNLPFSACTVVQEPTDDCQPEEPVPATADKCP